MRVTLIVVLATVALIVAWRVVAARNEKRALSRIAADRDVAASLASYRAALSEVPDELRTDIYKLLQGLLPVQDFPIQPADGLWTLYQFDQGTLESRIEDHLDARGVVLRPIESESGVETVQELVRMLHNRTKRAQGEPPGSDNALERTRGG